MTWMLSTADDAQPYPPLALRALGERLQLDLPTARAVDGSTLTAARAAGEAEHKRLAGEVRTRLAKRAVFHEFHQLRRDLARLEEQRAALANDKSAADVDKQAALENGDVAGLDKAVLASLKADSKLHAVDERVRVLTASLATCRRQLEALLPVIDRDLSAKALGATRRRRQELLERLATEAGELFDQLIQNEYTARAITGGTPSESIDVMAKDLEPLPIEEPEPEPPPAPPPVVAAEPPLEQEMPAPVPDVADADSEVRNRVADAKRRAAEAAAEVAARRQPAAV